MTCHHVPLASGGHAILCTREKAQRCACGHRATLLCDWKIPGKRSGTCDAPICSGCTTSPARDKDLCRKPAQEYQAWSAQRSAGSA